MARIILSDASLRHRWRRSLFRHKAQFTDGAHHLSRRKLHGTDGTDHLQDASFTTQMVQIFSLGKRKLHGTDGTDHPFRRKVCCTNGTDHFSMPKFRGTDGTDHPPRRKLDGTASPFGTKTSSTAQMAQIILQDTSCTAQTIQSINCTHVTCIAQMAEIILPDASSTEHVAQIMF
jgi:hypothetical protein